MPFEYPGNFDTRAFPAGGRIAATRALGILIMMTFLLIGCVCGLLAWAVHSNRVEPFLIMRDSIIGEWYVIGERKAGIQKYSTAHTMQESVAINFTKNWFTIYSDADRNNALWRACNQAECSGGEVFAYGDGACALSCSADPELFDKFMENTMSDYLLRAAGGETWTILPEFDIVAVGNVKESGSLWRIKATVVSNIKNMPFDIIAFVRLEKKQGAYPMTTGYYVADFNAYRLN